MDCKKIGEIIHTLRKEKGLTQKELAGKLGVSDKAVSKWERGLGCPDISLLGDLSDTLGVSTKEMLLGNLDENMKNGGNMKKISFYACKKCGNIITATNEFEGACCARQLEKLISKQPDEMHQLHKEIIDGEYFITLNHDMTKEHFISFVSYVTYDRILFVKLYPEQNAELRFPQMRGGKFYYYCNNDGLFISK